LIVANSSRSFRCASTASQNWGAMRHVSRHPAVMPSVLLIKSLGNVFIPVAVRPDSKYTEFGFAYTQSTKYTERTQ
jgi:hypothetical protein